MNKHEAFEYINNSNRTIKLDNPACVFNLETGKLEEGEHLKPVLLRITNLSSLDDVKNIVDDNDYIFILDRGLDSVIQEVTVPVESNYPGLSMTFVNYTIRHAAFTDDMRATWLKQSIKEKQTIADCKAKKLQ